MIDFAYGKLAGADCDSRTNSLMATSVAALEVTRRVKGTQPPQDAGQSVLNLEEIIQGFVELPEMVRQVPFTSVNYRIMSRQFIRELCHQHCCSGSRADWSKRIARRQRAIAPFLDKFLVCVFIRLPGIHYTIEVDPVSKSVVHWEWQSV